MTISPRHKKHASSNTKDSSAVIPERIRNIIDSNIAAEYDAISAGETRTIFHYEKKSISSIDDITISDEIIRNYIWTAYRRITGKYGIVLIANNNTIKHVRVGSNSGEPLYEDVQFNVRNSKNTIGIYVDKGELSRELNSSFVALNSKGNFHRSEAQLQGMVERCASDFLSLPEVAPELYRPIDPETKKSIRRVDPDTGEPETIVRFLERVWYDPWIKERVLTRPEFRRLDPQGEMAIRNFQRDPKNKWPDHLHLLTRAEVLENDLARADQLEGHLTMANRIRAGRQRRKQQDQNKEETHR